MNLTINSISSVDRAYGLSSQNKNSKNENVSFEGLKMSSKQVKGAAIGFALFAASVLGLSACKSNDSKESKESANTEYVARSQDIEKLEKSEEAENVSYDKQINEYMAQDKKVANVEIYDDTEGDINSYCVRVGKGYDKDGKLIRKFVIYLPKQSPSYSYYSGESDYTSYEGIQYLPDKTITENFAPEEDGKTVEIVYNKPVKFEGESGYKKTEVLADYPDLQEGVYAKTVIYTKGKEQISSECAEYSKDFRKCVLFYDKNGKLLEKRYFVPDKDYSSLVLDEKKSVLK